MRNAEPRPTTYEEWEALEADRDRLASELQECRAELERVRRNHLRRMAEATWDRLIYIQHGLIEKSVMDASTHKRLKARMKRFSERCRAALANMETGRG